MEVLKLKTFFLNQLLSEDKIEKYNASNSVIVSHILFQEITNKESNGKVSIIGLYYKNKKIYVDIIDSHSDEPNIMYVPLWIYQYFNYQEDELVNYMQVYPKTGNKIKIKPKGDFYAYLEDPVSALRDGFEKYSCLLKNTIILINVNGIPLEVEILETYIKNQPICIRGVELEVEIEEQVQESAPVPEPVPVPAAVPVPVPVPAPDPDDFDDFSSMLPTTNNTNKHFPGKGYNLR